MSIPEETIKVAVNVPLAIAWVVAVLGIAGLLLVDHGPWNKPVIKGPAAIEYSDTATAAKAAGATVTPTERRSAIEPTAPGPRPAQPAVPN